MADATLTVSSAGEVRLEDFEELLTEVSALAIRLAQNTRRVQTARDLPAGGTSVLKLLSRFGALTVPQMARLDCSSRQNIQIIVNRLQKEGCVEFAPNPGHKRSDLVRLTERGMASMKAVVDYSETYTARILPTLSKADLLGTLAMLRSIREAIDGSPNSLSRAKSADPKQRFQEPSFEFQATPSRAEPFATQETSFEDGELPINLL